MRKWFVLVWCLVCLPVYALPLKQLQLPPGFKISVYARVPNARSMTLGKNGVIYVGTRSLGKVFAVFPNRDRTRAAQIKTLLTDLFMPNGVAYHDGKLYVAAVSHLYVLSNIDRPNDRPVLKRLPTSLPTSPHHGWRYIAFGPDGWLYIASGAPCNVCVSKNPLYATILRMKPNGRDLQVYAKGVRNSVGFAWSPVDNTLWFTDNGRDWLGDDLPPDELNHAPRAGMNFGFPYYYGNNMPDPKFGHLKSTQGMTPPVQELGPHVAALGMLFYTGKMFPAKYRQQIFIAEHGSWNRSKKIGYRVMEVTLKNGKATSYRPFISGWLQGQKDWGRPVDLLQLPDGSLLISDDKSGTIYRVTYK